MRAGNPVNALGQAIAQQQFNALVDVMTYEELYEYFGGALPHIPSLWYLQMASPLPRPLLLNCACSNLRQANR